MSVTINIGATPPQYAPVNGNIWFQLTSPSTNVNGFKYVIDLYTYDLVTTTTTASSLGMYKFPPAAFTGDGLMDMHRPLQSQITYDLNPTIEGPYPAAHSIVRYGFKYGYEYNPAMRITSMSNQGGFLGLSFSTSPHNFGPGDKILINKDNKTLNTQYDGVATVTTNLGNSVGIVTNKVYLQPTTTPETGYVDNQLVLFSPLTGFYAFNGTRQYEERWTDFGGTAINGVTHSYLQKGIATQSIGNNHALSGWISGVTVSTYNSNFQDANAKRVSLNDYETVSYLIDNTATLIQSVFVNTYDSNFNLLNFQSYTYNLNAGYRRIDVGCGPKNLPTALGVASASYYMVALKDGTNYYGCRLFKVKENEINKTCSPWPTTRLAWLNRLGGFDYYSFNWKNTNTISTAKTMFRRDLDWNYTVGDREQMVLNQLAFESYTISSDFVSEREANWFKELITSPEVYVITPTGGKLPIVLTNTDYEVKRVLTTPLIAVTINYKMAHTLNVQTS